MAGIAGYFSRISDGGAAREFLSRAALAMGCGDQETFDYFVGRKLGVLHTGRTHAIVHSRSSVTNNSVGIISDGPVFSGSRVISDQDELAHLCGSFDPQVWSSLLPHGRLVCWDSAEEAILLSRGLGAPLYLVDTDKYVAFASDLSVLIRALDRPVDLDFESLNDLLAIGFLPGHTSPFRGVGKARANSWIRVSTRGTSHWPVDETPIPPGKFTDFLAGLTGGAGPTAIHLRGNRRDCALASIWRNDDTMAVFRDDDSGAIDRRGWIAAAAQPGPVLVEVPSEAPGEAAYPVVGTEPVVSCESIDFMTIARSVPSPVTTWVSSVSAPSFAGPGCGDALPLFASVENWRIPAAGIENLIRRPIPSPNLDRNRFSMLGHRSDSDPAHLIRLTERHVLPIAAAADRLGLRTVFPFADPRIDPLAVFAELPFSKTELLRGKADDITISSPDSVMLTRIDRLDAALDRGVPQPLSSLLDADGLQALSLRWRNGEWHYSEALLRAHELLEWHESITNVFSGGEA